MWRGERRAWLWQLLTDLPHRSPPLRTRCDGCLSRTWQVASRGPTRQWARHVSHARLALPGRDSDRFDADAVPAAAVVAGEQHLQLGATAADELAGGGPHGCLRGRSTGLCPLADLSCARSDRSPISPGTDYFIHRDRSAR